MLDYVYGHDEIVSAFVASLIPHCRRGFGNAKTIGVIDHDGSLLAGIVYYNYDPDAAIIEIAGASRSPRWLTRETIARMYQYPFLQIGCQMIVQRTPADDERLLRQLAVYNYRFLAMPRLFGRERDGVICMRTIEDWMNNRFNARLKHHVVDEQVEEAA